MPTHNFGFNYHTAQRERFAHPDGIAYVIAQENLAEALRRDPEARLDLNITLNDLILITAQHTSRNPLTRQNIEETTRRILREAGYSAANGYDVDNREVRVDFKEQSGDISRSVDDGGAGDTLTKHGYATNKSHSRLPWEYILLKEMTLRLDSAYRNGEIKGLWPDGKLNLTVVYENREPVYVSDVTVAAQHSPDVNIDDFREEITRKVVLPSLGRFYNPGSTRITIDGTDWFNKGGPLIDTGVKGKKDASFMYGDRVGQTGGSSFGKDFTKVDVHGIILPRYIANNLVANGIVEEVEIKVKYEIGTGEPLVLDFSAVESQSDKAGLAQLVRRNFPLSRNEVIQELGFIDPNLLPLTARDGWFGNELFPWEQVKKLQ